VERGAVKVCSGERNYERRGGGWRIVGTMGRRGSRMVVL